MPNTLIHIALQAPLSRALVPRIQIPWILLGLIIPDIPWILQRIAVAAQFADPYQMRLYFTSQASLLFCLMLSFTFALFAKRIFFVFSVLALNNLLHLLLDALQIKWGNGVHLLAPFSWNPVHFGVLWPEHSLMYLLTLAGLFYLLKNIKTIVQEGIVVDNSFQATLKNEISSPRSRCVRQFYRRHIADIRVLGLPSRRKFSRATQRLKQRAIFQSGLQWKAGCLSLALYFLLPLFFMSHIQSANSNYVEIIDENGNRAGRMVELDRSYYSAKEATIALFTGENVSAIGHLPEKSGIISIKGRFLDQKSIQIEAYHAHSAMRDYASIIGVLFSIIMWAIVLSRRLKKNRGSFG